MTDPVVPPTQSNQALSYRDAGVDIEAGNALVERIKPLAAKTRRPGVMAGLGGFGSLFELPLDKYKQPVLVSGTDGVGTKLRLAIEAGIHDTIGIDLVAMCVNDIICHGATPFAFLDYYATGKLVLKKSKEILKGIQQGCEIADCQLVGGETAEMPGVYTKSNFDLAGFAIGLVHAQDERPKNVKVGDNIIGIPSSGLHSNGFSLIRKLYKEYTEEMLTPTRIYTHNVLPIIKHINALAHITGGGIHGNLPRVLPKGTSYKLKFKYSKQWQELYKKTKFSKAEFENTFNCGWGMLVVAKKLHDTDKILDHIKDAKVIGEVIGT